jgi:hypothetical protein
VLKDRETGVREAAGAVMGYAPLIAKIERDLLRDLK